MNPSLRIASDNEQDRAACRTWWAEATEADKLAVWGAIQEPQADPVWEVVTRFAQLAFGEMMEGATNRSPR